MVVIATTNLAPNHKSNTMKNTLQMYIMFFIYAIKMVLNIYVS